MRQIGLAVVLGLTLITPVSAEAQSSKIPKVGILTPAVEGDPSLMPSRCHGRVIYPIGTQPSRGRIATPRPMLCR